MWSVTQEFGDKPSSIKSQLTKANALHHETVEYPFSGDRKIAT
jgi:hypothetical protein